VFNLITISYACTSDCGNQEVMPIIKIGRWIILLCSYFLVPERSTHFMKMMELCQTPTPTFDNRPSPTLLSPPPPPLAAAYTLVVYDDNFCQPFLPAISNDDVTSIVLNKQVFRPIPTRIRPIVRTEINNYPSHVGVFDKQQVLFRPIPMDDEV